MSRWFAAAWQIAVHLLAGLCIWNYSHNLFWGLSAAIGSLAPLIGVMQGRTAQRIRNREIEASWHAAYRDEELKDRPGGRG